MKTLKISLFLFLALLVFTTAALSCDTTVLQSSSSKTKVGSVSQKDLLFLRKWIGKYPTNKSRKYRSFFYVPQVKAVLTDILGKKGFNKLLAHFQNEEPIEEIDGYLVMLGTTNRQIRGGFDYALVVLNPKNCETHVMFVDNKILTGYGNTSAENSNLPEAIENKIEIYTQ